MVEATQRIVPRQYDLFVGLDVDKSRIAVTLTDHEHLLKSLQMPYSSEDLLNYLGKHYAGSQIALAYEVGPGRWCPTLGDHEPISTETAAGGNDKLSAKSVATENAGGLWPRRRSLITAKKVDLRPGFTP